MAHVEQTVSRLDIPAGNWAAHQLRLVYDDTKELFSSRLSQRENTKFQSQYNLQFVPRSSRPINESQEKQPIGNEKNKKIVFNPKNVNKRTGEKIRRTLQTIKEVICPEKSRSYDFHDWNIPNRFIQNRNSGMEDLQTGMKIRQLSACSGKMRIKSSCSDSVSSNILPSSPFPSETSTSKNAKNKMNGNLPTVSKSSNRFLIRSQTQPELKKFPSVSPTPFCKKESRESLKSSSSRRHLERAVPETNQSEKKADLDPRKKKKKKMAPDDAMRAAELRYKIDCILKKALFPDIYQLIQKRLHILPLIEQEMLFNFFKTRAELITEVRRSEKLKNLLQFLIRGRTFGMQNPSTTKIQNDESTSLTRHKLQSPRKWEKRFELTTWHHQPIYKPTRKASENISSIFVNACHVPARCSFY